MKGFIYLTPSPDGGLEGGRALIWIGVRCSFIYWPRSPVDSALSVGHQDKSKQLLSLDRDKPRLVFNHDGDISYSYFSLKLSSRINSQPVIDSKVVMIHTCELKPQAESWRPVIFEWASETSVRSGISDISRCKLNRNIFKWYIAGVGDFK